MHSRRAVVLSVATTLLSGCATPSENGPRLLLAEAPLDPMAARAVEAVQRTVALNAILVEEETAVLTENLDRYRGAFNLAASRLGADLRRLHGPSVASEPLHYAVVAIRGDRLLIFVTPIEEGPRTLLGLVYVFDHTGALLRVSSH